MHQSVLDNFFRFTVPLEGKTNNAYLDVKGLLTVGIGCMIDPPVTALPLPWVMPDGSVAPASVIEAQLTSLKAQTGLEHYPANSPSVLAATTIRLTDDGVMQLANQRLLAGEPLMRKTFPAWDTWPADAQLFACSMGWAIGFGWPHIFSNCAALLQRTVPGFLLAATGSPSAHANEASAPCDIRTEGNPGIVPRNAQNRLLLSNAQVVRDEGLDPDILYWPSSPLIQKAQA
jgi:hypothetical protein